MQANMLGILAQDSSTDGMERASPRKVDLAQTHRCAGDPFDAAGHVEGSAPGERQKQNPVRVDAVDDNMSYPVGQRLRLPRPSALDHKEWAGVEGGAIPEAVFDGTALLLVQVSQIIVWHKCA